MLKNKTLGSFSSTLINWYHKNKRDLPWRETKEPYKIWLSEIILQQTRVNQGLNYYYKFIQTYPTIKKLANASQDEVLKLWQGLGYYSRARSLHETAKNISSIYKGIFPNNYQDVIALKGIGEYTAAAICSFAYDQAYAVVDGNVYRVLSRILGISTPIDSTKGKKEFKLLAEELLDKENPATYNQAIMEFGALQCVPNNPDCFNCVLKDLCFACKNEIIQELPVKEKKNKQKNRYFNYLYIINNNHTYLHQRTKNDVWKGLYEFPLIETEKEVSFEELIQTNAYKKLMHGAKSIEIQNEEFKLKHTLSHQKIHSKFYTLKIVFNSNYTFPYVLTSFNQLWNAPVSRLTELFLETLK